VLTSSWSSVNRYLRVNASLTPVSTRPLQNRSRGLPILALRELNVGVLHLRTQNPPAKPWPEIPILSDLFPVFTNLSDIELAYARLGYRLNRHDLAPSFCAEQLTLAALPFRERWLDERGVDTEVREQFGR
jgi:hypothetical protein